MKVTQRKVESERVAFIGDIHIPFQDQDAVDLTLSFLRWFKPHFVYLIGDILDFYAVSRFDKDPERINGLQDELNKGKTFLKSLRSATGKETTIVYLQGNHEDRLIKYLWKHPEVSSLESMKLESLLGLNEFDIPLFPYSKQLSHKGFLIEHGDMCRSKSGYTAMAMLERRQVSGICGHVHRLGAHYRTDNTGMKVWLENGCLSTLFPEYIHGPASWQHGFSVAHFMQDDNRFFVEQIPIIKHRIYYSGVLWS